MPELPEVEVVRAGLHRHVTGRVINAVDVLHPRAIRRHEPGASDFAGRLAGARIASVRRRGKYLWFDLGGDALLAHLGMSGQLLVQPSGSPDETHLRVRFSFADNDSELRFVDQRTFGGFALATLVDVDGTGGTGGFGVPDTIAHIGLDPMDERFDVERAARALRRKRTEVKRALLDQNLVSGIGNIYADEALWHARLHGQRPTDRLTTKQATEVLDAATAVMAESLKAGGTSFDALYVNVNGQSGYFARSLNVYGRAGEPCHRCGTPIQREQFMNRSSYFCPRCQPKPRRRRTAP